METFSKVSETKLAVSTPVEVITIEKTLDELEADLKQAQDSLAYVQERQAQEVAGIQTTIDLFQKRVDEAKKLGVVKLAKDVLEGVIK